VTIEGRQVRVRAWRYDVKGTGDFVVPVYLLDTDLKENAPEDRALTHQLYGGDARYRLCQEMVLGVGGLRMLRALGFTSVRRFHMNEGHAGLLTLELLDERLRWDHREQIMPEDLDAIRQQCMFTTHTPVPAGHDQFPMEVVEKVLGPQRAFQTMPEVFCCDGVLNMTSLALNLSHYINGVAKKHGEVSREMFPGTTSSTSPTGCTSRRGRLRRRRDGRRARDGRPPRRCRRRRGLGHCGASR
jgi:starch phosphorylase